jgi:serine/threonine-protein phosphatase 2A regulatory subunit B
VFAADIISCVEFNETGELLATGDKGGRVVVFQRDQSVSNMFCSELVKLNPVR